nr:MAG TPA: hypothetical protein [Caudoviricetes sp.]
MRLIKGRVQMLRLHSFVSGALFFCEVVRL